MGEQLSPLSASPTPTLLTRLLTVAFSGLAGEVKTDFAFRYVRTGAHPEDQRNTYNECGDT